MNMVPLIVENHADINALFCAPNSVLIFLPLTLLYLKGLETGWLMVRHRELRAYLSPSFRAKHEIIQGTRRRYKLTTPCMWFWCSRSIAHRWNASPREPLAIPALATYEILLPKALYFRFGEAFLEEKVLPDAA